MSEVFNIRLVCQKCREEKASTRTRTLHTKDYKGPCSDSFCYASCESTVCRPITVTVCDACEVSLVKEDPRPAKKTEKRDCDGCLNRCMDMDMDPYCAAVNRPWGQALYTGIPKECGPKRLLWEKDTRGVR